LFFTHYIWSRPELWFCFEVQRQKSEFLRTIVCYINRFYSLIDITIYLGCKECNYLQIVQLLLMLDWLHSTAGSTFYTNLQANWFS
jgi:hypothetical protein